MNAQGIDTDGQTIEPMLEALVRQHGLKQVEAALSTLFGKARFADYQRVQNIAQRIGRRIEKEKQLT